ncbi:MAG: alanyl-tRNA editing protein [Candidatus Micrarchaeaceae archaeon]
MTEKLYFRDPYLKEFEANVIKIDGNKVYLDRTAFYPTGGGQPNDTGRIIAGSDIPVTDVAKEGDEIAHIVSDASALKEGIAVRGIIDWEKRLAYMRHHTAIHLIDGVVTKVYADKGLITGSQIYSDRARMDFDMPTLNKDLCQKIIDDSNNEAEAGRAVVSRDLTKAEALAIPNLARTAPGRELISKLDVIRVVEIVGLDMQADGGLHVSNTNEIGKICLNGFKNNGAHSKRMEIRLE